MKALAAEAESQPMAKAQSAKKKPLAVRTKRHASSQGVSAEEQTAIIALAKRYVSLHQPSVKPSTGASVRQPPPVLPPPQPKPTPQTTQRWREESITPETSMRGESSSQLLEMAPEPQLLPVSIALRSTMQHLQPQAPRVLSDSKSSLPDSVRVRLPALPIGRPPSPWPDALPKPVFPSRGRSPRRSSNEVTPAPSPKFDSPRREVTQSASASSLLSTSFEPAMRMQPVRPDRQPLPPRRASPAAAPDPERLLEPPKHELSTSTVSTAASGGPTSPHQRTPCAPGQSLQLACSSMSLASSVASAHSAAWSSTNAGGMRNQANLQSTIGRTVYREEVMPGVVRHVRKSYSDASTCYFDGSKGEERLIRGDDPDGRVQLYDGSKGQEHLVRLEFPDGSTHHFSGQKGQEHLVRIEFPDGIVEHYEEYRGQERLVLVEFPDGRNQHFEGQKGTERLVRDDNPDGKVQHFDGPKDMEHCVFVEFPDGTVQNFEGRRGEERLVASSNVITGDLIGSSFVEQATRSPAAAEMITYRL